LKIGLILECGPDGADLHVCKHLVKLLLPKAEILFATMGDKPNLLKQCGDAASLLLREGCERVAIIWDLYPAWRERGKRPCLHADREDIFRSLDQARVERARVALVCIVEELEAWLLADGRALSIYLSTPIRAVTIDDQKNPERVSNPKGRLTQIMREHKGRKYEDYTDAKKIVEHIVDLSRLRKCKTFKRFEEKLTR
jgi:hypothetical protein